MADLFDKKTQYEPLAARMRPRNLDEYVGQSHIVGKGCLLRRAISADRLSSVIFYGPPGCGKTTLARVIATHTKSNFITINAVLSGVQSIRDAIDTAANKRKLYDQRTILFVDEVHRWNKSQQDALLPWVENGTIILVGATTENPFFEVNRALVSRSRVFQLLPLTDEDLFMAARQALCDRERGYGRYKIRFEDGALEHLVKTASGDARSLLNALELAVETSVEEWPPADGTEVYISKEDAEQSIQKKVVLYDKDGDYHYDTISAFIKSLRGRDPDAALYWLARMVAAGEDPHFIFRRMLISACEDTGLADPHAISVVESCAAAFDRIGMPEGRYHLAHATLYLATCPKSNSSMGFFDALSSVQAENAEVPNHLKDANRDGEGFGHGAGYLYPHAYKDHWTAQQYLPNGLEGRVFYTPSAQGYEKNISDEVLSRRELQLAAMWEREERTLLPFESGGSVHKECLKTKNPQRRPREENLTFSPKNTDFERWQRRTDENTGEILRKIRDTVTENARVVRHSRVLVLNGDNGVFLWELVRRCPEGLVTAFCDSADKIKILEHYCHRFSEMEKPFLFQNSSFLTENFTPENWERDLKKIGDAEFDKIFLQKNIRNLDEAKKIAENLCRAKENPRFAETEIFFFAKIARKSENPAQILSPLFENRELAETFSKLCSQYYDGSNFFDERDIAAVFSQNRFAVSSFSEFFDFEFYLDEARMDAFFSEDSAFHSLVAHEPKTLDAIKAEVKKLLSRRGKFVIKTCYAFFAAQ